MASDISGGIGSRTRGGGSGLIARIGRALRATALSTALAAFIVPQMVVLTAVSLTASLVGLGVGLLLVLPTFLAVRRVTSLRRELAANWSGVEIPEPYLPMPEAEPGLRSLWQRCQSVLGDPATWRDIAWLLADSVIGFTLAILPLSFIVYGLFGLAMPWVWEPIVNNGGNDWYLWVKVTDDSRALLCTVHGLPLIAAGLAMAPAVLRGHGLFARTLLGPTARAEALAAERKVAHLTETRRDALTTQAAELRRIERDLHDGAQARLVAMGMNIGVAERLLERDPKAAKELLAETRQASAAALGELRDLVRGIHPPVLADRGLADAVRALGLDSPLDVAVTADLPGRPEAPVESAIYFAVSEALTNAAKHSGADRVDVQLWYEDGKLRAQVTDDGTGGADPSRGSGLRGLERRLATFDGILAVRSPLGGPTTLTMELPCELYSPRTSSS
ncbi:sensor histidine kinase [Streptomyces sp. NRRL WC-3742]|uniref:sensor histidine kinase n=1 Tax=Streptomyces sp. NRRL WC-3742 TaxID=1463934 RepID=UPI0004C8BD27|nr:sensor histidine kinase [Streptomyces sp. NRRL WC-3742]